MCRIFAFVAPERSNARHELGAEGVDSLLTLAALHGDGWGWAGVEAPGAQPEVRKSGLSAVANTDFDDAVVTPSQAGMVHLRWATAGQIVDCNAHPFQANGLAFEHNGSLKPIERVREMLSPTSLASLSSDTDSEMYFALIHEQIEQGKTPHEAVVAVVRQLREAFPLASLNSVLLTPEHMVVVRASASSGLSDADRALMAHVELPSEHAEDYYALRWKQQPDGAIVISSTGVAGEDWQSLPPESVTAIDLRDLSMTTLFVESKATPG